jgi:GMP synthase-like glutamine amidotransferase
VQVLNVHSEFITQQNVAEKLEGLDGLLVAPGFGTRGIDGKIIAVQYAREQGLPFFGICLGGQLLATAVDGKVGPTPVPEIGVASFRVTADAAQDSVFGHLAGKEVIAAEWHKDYITDLPDEAVVLAGNDVCPVQAFRIGENVYGVQFHPEIDSEIFSSWAATDDELAKLDHTIKQACEQVAVAEAELIKTWKPAFQAWSKLVKDQQATLQ